MANQRTRLFVITDPQAQQQTALIKALLLARMADCEIHAFTCVYRDLDEGGEYASRQDLKHQTLVEARQWLAERLEALDMAGVPHTSEVVWNSRWHEIALREIARSNCDLVIKSSFHHGRARRFFSKTSDYNLMRNCACPVLFVHHEQDWQSNRLLACVDLESGDPQHARLNKAILNDARALANFVGMELHIASAYASEINIDNLPFKQHGKQPTAERLAEIYDVDAARVHLRRGETVAVLEALCAEIDPSIVVMGTLARTGIKGKLIGNTAEKLLDLTRADVLTVN